MPVRQRKPNDITQQLVPLLLLGIGLVTSNNSVTFIDDEALILGAAANPLRKTAALFLSGASQRPPLYDIVLHFWLRWTGGNFDYLRIPSVLFLIAGLFLLGRASSHLMGSKGGTAVIWLGTLWPFGFHYGRLATWYSFSFFLVAGLTLSYLKYLDSQTTGRWAVLFFFCASLIWTNYFGWAILGCLVIDQVIRSRAKEPVATPKALLGTAALLCLTILPFVSALRATISHRTDLHQRAITVVANLGFSVFSIFVSESVAPWYWWLSIPAGIAVLLCAVLGAWWAPRLARRYLIYGAALMVVMALLGMLNTKGLLMISPWILLPLGVAIESTKPRWATFGLAAAFLAIGATGWYGIYSRRYYSATRFTEPWQEVARDAVAKIHDGATVIADHPSFLFYLTYFLHVPQTNGPWQFAGLVTDLVNSPQVYSPSGWLSAGRPTSGKMVLIRGGATTGGKSAIEDVVRELDMSCGSISSRLRVRDSGYKWKQKFYPQLTEPLWRIEIREYDCDSSNSKQIYRIPPR